MKFDQLFHKTALHIAIEKENIEIVQILLTQENIDINQQYIKTNTNFFMSF